MFDTGLLKINKALEHIKDSKKSTLSIVFNFKFNPMFPKLIKPFKFLFHILINHIEH